MRALPPTSSQVTSPQYCYLEKEITPSVELRVVCAGRERCDPCYKVERDRFPCFGLEFVADGEGRVVLDPASYPLSPGVMFCYGPETGHRILNRLDRPMTKYFVDFVGTEAEGLFIKGHFAPGGAVRILDVEPMRFLFDELIDAGLGDSAISKDLCSAYLRVILLKAANGVVPSPKTSPLTASQFHRWLEYINAHFTRLRDLHDIAAELNTRPAQLCRVFKQHGHAGPFRYLTQKKMNFAAQLLAARRVTVREAAEQVGYADPYHFSRLFKRHFGQSPVNFQRHFRRSE